jgi:tRNA(adenine34) deaminase
MKDHIIFSEEYFMKEALKEAQKAYEIDEVPIGAIIVCNNTIVARAYNQTELLTDFTAHAEMLALTSASNYLGNKYLDQCTLYVTLEPCLMCAGAMFWTRLKSVVYGCTDEKRGYLSIAPGALHPKTIIKGGVLAGESEQLIKKFFGKKR